MTLKIASLHRSLETNLKENIGKTKRMCRALKIIEAHIFTEFQAEVKTFQWSDGSKYVSNMARMVRDSYLETYKRFPRDSKKSIPSQKNLICIKASF